MGNVHRRASDILAKHRLGFLGLIVEDNRNHERDFHNAADQTTHQISIAISSADGEDGLSFDMAREDLPASTFSGTTSAAATTNALAVNELVDIFNSSAEYTQFAWASADGANIVLTSLFSGADGAFTVSGISAPDDLAAAATTVTTGAEASSAPFGSVIMASPAPGTSGYLNLPSGWGRDNGRLGELRGRVIPSGPSAASTAVTVATAEDTKTARAFVTVGAGPTLSADFAAGADEDATATNLAAAVDALPTVSSAASGAVATVTGAVGQTLDVTILPLEAQTTAFAVVDTSSSVAPVKLLGIVAYKPTMHDTRIIGEAATGIAPGEEGIVLEEGFFITKLDAQITGEQTLYVGTAGSEQGNLFTSASATRVKWDRCIGMQALRDGFTLVRLLPLS